ncbi:GumC family protein [Rubrivirga sp.]|uniref:GumC family protein n=1 Tax=Rubrivirga sp. TaxID=1885344 RepID=UPI003B522EDE
MSDRPPQTRPDAPLSGVYASAEDAVFEDLSVPGDGAARTATPQWDAVEPPAVEALPTEPPVVQLGDPFREQGDGAPALDYDPDDGFRIDFDDEDEAPTTALAPVPHPAPAARPSGPPAPPPVPPVSASPRDEARRSTRRTLRMLRRHWPVVLGLTALGLAAGAAHGLLAEPTYRAHSVLLIVADDDAVGGVARAPGEDVSRVVNQGLVLQQAPEIAQRTAEALMASPEAGSFSVVRAAAERYGEPVTADVLADHLQESVVSIEQAADQADAIRVEAEAGGADEAALIARLYTDEYTSLTQSTSRQRSTQTRQALDEQIARRQGELDEIEHQLERFMTSQNAAGLDEQTRVTVSQIGQLQGQLDLARVEAQTNRARLGQLRADLASIPARLERSADVPSAVETADLDTEIARLERLLEQIYTQNPELRGDPTGHPDVAGIDRRLADLRADRRRRVGAQTDAAVAAGGLDLSSQGSNGQAYVAELQRQISSVQADLAGAEARAATLSQRLGQARGQLRAVPGQQVELDQLERQRSTTEATLGQLRGEFDRAELAETTELGFAQVLREVQVPREPASPSLPLSLGLGGVAGLLLGLGLTVLRAQADTHVRTPDDLRDHGFTVVGTVPDLKAALRGGRQEVEGAPVHPGLVALTRAFAPEAEAFRHLHAGLYAGGGGHPQVVLVAGPDAHAGTSLVAANLAVAAAQAGRRTLLVDADLRHPAVADLFGLGGRAPLGEGPPGSNMVYWSTAVPSLLAMTPRETAQSPEQMWAPHQIGTLLLHLRDAFDLVIVDTPSALASADAALLAPHADAALLVAQADRTDVEAMAQVATELAGVGLTRVGAVLNRFDPRRAVGFKATAGVRHAARA